MKKTLPPCVYFKHSAYWYVKQGKWQRLGNKLGPSLAEYGNIIEAPKGGMAALVDEALQAKTGLADSSRRQYLGAAAIIKRKLQDFAPEQVKPKDVVQVKKSMSATPNMANRVLSVMRGVFDYALIEERIDYNPCVGIKPYPEAKRKRLISLDEWIAIYNEAAERLQLIMRIQYLTGQRISDVLAIRRNQLTDDGIEFDQKKTEARLTVRWSPDLRDAVDEALALLGDAPTLTLFRSATGKPPDYRSVHEQWTRACLAAEVEDARPNDQRAQSATATRQQGKNPTALLGHASAQMTDRYLRDRERPVVDGPSFKGGRGR
jgi:integrase